MDCFVLASTRTEGVPQSLLQAAAAGVPVVASRIGGIPEVVEDGVTGLLVPPEDPAALAAAIERDARRSRRRRRAGRAPPRKRCEERFSHAAAIGRLLALYDELLGARTATRGVAPAPPRAAPRRQSLVDGQRGPGHPPRPRARRRAAIACGWP